jgi:hypothetical protein
MEDRKTDSELVLAIVKSNMEDTDKADVVIAFLKKRDRERKNSGHKKAKKSKPNLTLVDIVGK